MYKLLNLSVIWEKFNSLWGTTVLVLYSNTPRGVINSHPWDMRCNRVTTKPVVTKAL